MYKRVYTIVYTVVYTVVYTEFIRCSYGVYTEFVRLFVRPFLVIRASRLLTQLGY